MASETQLISCATRAGMMKAKRRGVHIGRPPLGGDHRKLAAKATAARDIAKLLERLEREIRKLARQGFSNREIAELLGCSESYVQRNLTP